MLLRVLLSLLWSYVGWRTLLALLAWHVALPGLGLFSGVLGAVWVLVLVWLWSYPYPWKVEERRRDR